MIVLWIILGLLAFILLLLCCPVRGVLGFGEELELTLRYLFIKIPVLPAPEKQEELEKKPKKEKKEEESDDAEEKKTSGGPLDMLRSLLKAEGFGGLLDLAGKVVKLSGTTVGRILKHMHIRAFDLYAVAAAEDAASAAMLYGEACAVLYSASEIFFRLVKCKNHRVTVDVDFDAQKPYVKLSAELYLRPIHLAHHGIRYLFGLLPLFIRLIFSFRKGAAMRRKPAKNGKEAKST